MLSERTQTKEIHLYKILEYAHSSIVRESTSVFAWGGGWGEKEGWITRQQSETLECDEYVHHPDSNDNLVSIYIYMSCVRPQSLSYV